MQKVKLTDVARLANVSRAAAGKVLNGGSAAIRVGAEARKRILGAARQLDYRPNMAASILAGGNSRLVGVLLDSCTSYRYLCLLREIEGVCMEHGYRIITSFTHDNIRNMEENCRMLLRYGVTGFLCCAHDYPQLKEEARDFFAGQNNIVYMEKPVCDGKPFVATSRVKALTRMIADALRNGCRKIGMLSGSLVWQTERTLHQEFCEAMRRNGLEPDLRLIAQYPETSSLSERMDGMMEQVILPFRPDFLYMDDAVHAVALLSRLHRAGLDHITIHGGNHDPLFEGMGLRSFDPCYRKIALNLLELLTEPEKHPEMPVVEAVYQGGDPG